MILTGLEIIKRIKQKDIVIDPFNEENINPASIDLTLGENISEYRPITLTSTSLGRGKNKHKKGVIDLNENNSVSIKRSIIDDNGFLIRANRPYLMHTAEMVYAKDLVGVVDGKSSLGRLFVSVHQTAGYIDPGFYGHVTLEVTSFYNIRVYKGMRFCQIRFHTVVGEVSSYGGAYVGDSAVGAVLSKHLKEGDGKK